MIRDTSKEKIKQNVKTKSLRDIFENDFSSTNQSEWISIEIMWILKVWRKVSMHSIHPPKSFSQELSFMGKDGTAECEEFGQIA